MGKELRGIRGKEAIKVFICAGEIEKAGKGDHGNTVEIAFRLIRTAFL